MGRLHQKQTRLTLYLSLTVVLILLLAESFFFQLEEFTYHTGSAKKLSPFQLGDSFLYNTFLGVNNRLESRQDQEIKNISRIKLGIISIDKETLDFFSARYKEPFPFPRKRYAQFLEKLMPFNPKAVGIDMEFLDYSKDPEDDRLFGEAVKKLKYVVVASSTTFKDSLENPELLPSDKNKHITQESLPVILPHELLNEYAGYATLSQGKDDIFTSTIPWFEMKTPHSTPRLSFAMQVFRRAMNIPWENIKFSQSQLSIGPHHIPLSNGMMRIYFSQSRAFPTLSFKDFFDEKRHADLLKGKEEFSGYTWIMGWDGIKIQDFADTFRTPVGRIPGPEIHANILNTVMSRLFIKELSPLTAPILSILISLILGFILPRCSNAAGNGLFVIISALLLGSGYFLLTGTRIYLPIFTPLATTISCFGIINLYHFALEKRNKDRIKSLFAGSVSKKVVEAMLDADHRQKLEEMMRGTKVTVTIFYSDIRGFTSLSEKLTPHEVFSLLNEYFDPMIKIIYKYDGFLDKFIGDCIMAVFSAPEQHPDDPLRAAKAALEMQDIIKQLQIKWHKEGQKGFSVGMGINTGEVILGSLGVVEEQGKWQMTVIGDAVNLAARLYAQAEGGQILISENTYKELASLVEVKSLEPFTVKGKQEPVLAYELLRFKNN